MKRFLQTWEGALLWVLFVPVPWLLFTIGWEATLQREEAALRRGVRNLLQTESDHFRTDLRGNDFLQHGIDRVAERFGFTDFATPVLLGREPASFTRACLRRLVAALRQETGALPAAVGLVGPAGRPCHVWLAPTETLVPEPDRGRRRFERLLTAFFRDFQPIRKRGTPDWDLKHRLRRESMALFGPDALIDGMAHQTGDFISQHHEHGIAYWAYRHGRPVRPDADQPRQGAFVVVFHHRDLNAARMAQDAMARAAPGFRRRLVWMPPSTLPRFEEGPDRLAYAEPLAETDFRRLLERDQAARFAAGFRPVLVTEASPSWWRSPRRAWQPHLQTGFALAAGLITLLLFRGIWLGGPCPGGLRANLAGGLALCATPWLVGVVLMAQVWLDIRAQGLVGETVEFLDQQLELVDQRIAYARDLEDRRLSGLRQIFRRLLDPADQEARQQLTQVAASTTIDFAFLFDRHRIVHTLLEGQPQQQNDLLNFFKGFAFHTLREAQENGSPTETAGSPADLLWRSLAEQLLDLSTLGRVMANEGRLQRSPFGNAEQAMLVFFLRRHPDPAPPIALGVTLGGVSFVERRLEDPLRQRTLMVRRTPAGFHTDIALYRYRDLMISGIQPIPHCHPEDRFLWYEFKPLAEATRSDLVGKVLRTSLNHERIRLAVSRPCQADRYIAVGIAQDTIDRPLERWRLLGMVTGTLGLLLAGLVAATSFFLIRPLGAFLAATRRAAGGDFAWRLTLPLRDEFTTLAGVFNLMAERLTERQRLSRFVSEDTLSAIAGEEEAAVRRGGTQIQTTVLVSDIRGFTSLTEAHPPEAIVDLLNDYFTVMETCITDQQGVIVSFIGDAILAHFPAQPERPGPATTAARALAAARAMRGALATLNQDRQARGLFQIATGIGIATGPTWSGVIGSQTGRLAQTILGETVDRATTLESATKLTGGSGILVDLATVEVAGAEVPFIEQPALGGWELVLR